MRAQGATEKFDRALLDLETCLEGEVAAGETSETRLTYDGLCFLEEVFFYRKWSTCRRRMHRNQPVIARSLAEPDANPRWAAMRPAVP